MKSILIVDDLESVRFYHQLLLKQAGFQAHTARDGIEALEILEREPIDLVMLDLLMPKMSGREFLERIRTVERFDGLPVLIISSEAQAETAVALQSLGPCSTLQKPLLPGSLLEAVQAMIG